MTDKQAMQADGDKAAATGNGVSDTGVKGDGQSSGAAYPNPHTGRERGRFDGGQSEKSYSGPDNPNATAK
jgi:hypothetical protein